MRHFITSDQHFWHSNILKYTKRIKYMTPEEIQMLNEGKDFKVSDASVDAMNDDLISNINANVMSEDVLWVLGDWCFGTRRYPNRLYELSNRIICKNRHIVFGNHDIRRLLAPHFMSNHEKLSIAIANDGRYWMGEDEINENKDCRHAQKIVLDHYASAIWNSSHNNWYALYGHSHSSAETMMENKFPGRKSMDVGVDNAFKLLGTYRPFSFEEIKEIMSKKPGYQSEDHHKNRRQTSSEK